MCVGGTRMVDAFVLAPHIKGRGRKRSLLLVWRQSAARDFCNLRKEVNKTALYFNQPGPSFRAAPSTPSYGSPIWATGSRDLGSGYAA